MNSDQCSATKVPSLFLPTNAYLIGIDATHNPEFTTCEFYQAYATIDDLINSTKEILVVLNSAKAELNPDTPKKSLEFDEISFLPALEKGLAGRGIKYRFPTEWSDESLRECLAETHPLLKHLNHHTQTWPQLLDSLASIALEPGLKKPTFVRDYPAIMSPLAKSYVDPTTGIEIAARAELFINGVEYANMYEEENDPFMQTKKFLLQKRYADQLDGIAAEEDVVPEGATHEELFQMLPPAQQYYVRVLEMGLPPTGGWGCGIDRLVMFFGGVKRISDVLPFGTLKTLIASST
jgi:lysyl-tRNA synthetase class 2